MIVNTEFECLLTLNLAQTFINQTMLKTHIIDI